MKQATTSIVFIAASAVLLLIGCNSPDLTSYDERLKFPLSAERKMAVLIAEPGPDGMLQPEDQVRFGEMARDFRDRGAGPIEIVVGAKGSADPIAQAFAWSIHNSLTAQGVPNSALQVAYATGGGAAAANRATVTFPIYVAVVPDCGISNMQPEALDFYNAHTDNYGCAIQRNIGLMAVNPLDLQQMQPATGRWGPRSSDIVNKYGQGVSVPSAKDVVTSTTQDTFGSGSSSN